MGKAAHFHIVEATPYSLCLRDIGPWDRHLTITNDAENVVLRVAHMLRGRRLFYYDSVGELTELCLTENCRFAGFKPAAMVR